MQSRSVIIRFQLSAFHGQGQSRLRWHWTGETCKSDADARGDAIHRPKRESLGGVCLLGTEIGKLELLLKGERNEFGISLGGMSLLQGPMDANFLSMVSALLCGLRLKAVGLPLSAGSISFVACFGNRFGALFIAEICIGAERVRQLRKISELSCHF